VTTGSPRPWCKRSRRPGRRPARQHDRCKNTPAGKVTAVPRLRHLAIAAYTRPMIGVEDQAAPAAMPPTSDVPAPVSDPVSHLSAVYRDYPGLRALILRRVRDPDLAADILQDAAVTTLEKLRSGEMPTRKMWAISLPCGINHLRNHRRKDERPSRVLRAWMIFGSPRRSRLERVGRPNGSLRAADSR